MAAGRNICRQYRNVLCIIPLLRQLWILRRQIVKACLRFFPGTEWASAAVGSCIDHRFPFMPVCTPPPDWRVTAIRDHLRRERSISRRVPFAQQRILARRLLMQYSFSGIPRVSALIRLWPSFCQLVRGVVPRDKILVQSLAAFSRPDGSVFLFISTEIICFCLNVICAHHFPVRLFR